MKTFKLFLFGSVISLISCGGYHDTVNLERWKQEIVDTEAAFAKLAAEAGIREAFITYAAPDAVLMRNNRLIKGDTGITSYLGKQLPLRDELLEWKPGFVDVSSSGDLAYTYGNYTYSFADSTGSRVVQRGVFHTVWKRQADGSWKFVWD